MKIKAFVLAGALVCSLLVGCNQQPHTHDWGEPTYTWNSDNSTCTAERVCKGDDTHVETETVNSTYAVTRESTCALEGVGQYTATFTNEAFATQNKTIDLEKKAHTWDEGEITKFPSILEDGEKTYHCVNCDATKTEVVAKTTDATNYTLDAERMEDLTGVFTAKAVVGADKASATLGIPLIAKQNLVDNPTYQSPGIIQGAAIDFEKKTGAVKYEWLPNQSEETLVAPYSYFRYSITKVSQQDADGQTRVYDKLSGFDGTYYIIRLDVSNLVANKTGYLHVKHEDNKALMVQVGMQSGVNTNIEVTLDGNNQPTVKPSIKNGKWYVGETDTGIAADPSHNDSLAYYSAITDANGVSKNYWFVGGTGFADGMGMKSMVYPLKDNAAVLKDKNGNHKDTPYIDIIVLSSSKLAAGADKGKETAPTSDISLSLYVDETIDYNPELMYDPTSQDVNHAANVAKKFFDETKAVDGTNKTSYLVKGDDLEIDVVTVETQKEKDINEFWSLNKAIDFQPYNEHTIKLLCEVPVLEGLNVHSKTEEYRKVILDVNSFDIQIANHSQLGTAGLIVSNNASLEILDGSNTVGAELAIGNNANMEVQSGGTLIIDETCQLEVEYDAASKVANKVTYDKVIEMITALPEIDAVTEKNRVDVESARGSYDLLSEEDKAKVTNYDKLVALETKLGPDTPLNNGEVTVRKGGKLINQGVINVEGLEVKPQANNQQESQQVVTRDMKAASLLVEDGGVIDNYGCMMIKGDLYLLGELNNYGKYSDPITATDPDKGQVTHHKGIQVTWKDDVTIETQDSTPEAKKYTVNPEVKPGTIHVGMDSKKNVVKTAKLNNYGDIVLCPGVIDVYGNYSNIKDDKHEGNLYMCAVSEAVVPVTPVNPTDPLEERRQFTPPYESTFNVLNAASYVNQGNLYHATIEILSNGIFGKLTILLEQQ